MKEMIRFSSLKLHVLKICGTFISLAHEFNRNSLALHQYGDFHIITKIKYEPLLVLLSNIFYVDH